MEKTSLNHEQIKRFLPHRAPFLLVDRIIEIHRSSEVNDLAQVKDKPGTFARALKNVTATEPHFQGHFPSFAIMPGVLQIEAMAQCASFCFYPYVVHNLEAWTREYVCVLAGIDGVRFRKPIMPGDVLEIKSEVTGARSKLWSFACQIQSDGQRVAEAQMMIQIAPYSELRALQ